MSMRRGAGVVMLGVLVGVVIAGCESTQDTPTAVPMRAGPIAHGSSDETATGAPAAAPIIGTPGPAELDPSDGIELPRTSLAANRKEAQRYAARLKDYVYATAFPRLSPTAWVDTGFSVGDKAVTSVIERRTDPRGGYTLIYDENANGDLRDDPRHDFVPIAGGFELTVPTTTTIRERAQTVHAPIRIRIVHGTPFEQRKMVRRGTIVIDGQPRRFWLRGLWLFDWPTTTIALDLDGDGVAGPAPVASDSSEQQQTREWDHPEVVQLSDKTINLGARTYDLAVDVHGDQLTLTPRATQLPGRRMLHIGTTAPDFAVDDLDGHPHQLSAMRGHPVLLDFWYTTCPSCIEAMPQLAEIYRRHHADGFEILSIASDTADSVRALFAKHPHVGLAALATRAINEPYRIGWYPTFILVDADGKIAVLRGSLDEVAAHLDAHHDH